MPSARLQGMGTAGVALSGETQVVYSNPAGLVAIEGLKPDDGLMNGGGCVIRGPHDLGRSDGRVGREGGSAEQPSHK